MGQLLNSLRNIGNLVSLLYLVETEMKPVNRNSSIISSIVSIICLHLEQNKEVFNEEDFDPTNMIGCRSFPSLWPILEFMLCSPNIVHLSENLALPYPIETFGDGPVIAAQLFIILSGNFGIYQYNSITIKALRLHDMQNTQLKKEVHQFIYCSSMVNQARNFTEVMIAPYVTYRPMWFNELLL